MRCSKCGKEVSEKVAQYSKEKLEKVYCYECQKEIKVTPKGTLSNKAEVTFDLKKIPMDRNDLIMKQVALKCATEIGCAQISKGKETTLERVLEIAEKMHEWLRT